MWSSTEFSEGPEYRNRRRRVEESDFEIQPVSETTPSVYVKDKRKNTLIKVRARPEVINLILNPTG